MIGILRISKEMSSGDYLTTDDKSALVHIGAIRQQAITGAKIDPYLCHHMSSPVGRLNKKDGLTRYGDSRVKDKTS